MLIHELTPEECRDVLSRSDVARLACARNDQPYVVPISFSYDAASYSLFSFSAVGKKVNWMRENAKVCLEVDEIADRFHWTTVVIFGRYQEIGDSPEQKDFHHRALHLFQQRKEWWLPGGARTEQHQPHAIVLYRIQIDSLTGRRAAREAN
jgi:nitroimidazol reductase NimA-like FMN-containing flavoprotein (pyridoxamine 5'-phosphate oxidase superfamily)